MSGSAQDTPYASLTAPEPPGADALLAAVPDAILAVDSGGRIVVANPAAHALLGCEPGTLAGQPVERFVSGWGRAEGPAPVPLELRRADGALVPAQARLARVQGPHGPVTAGTLTRADPPGATEARLRESRAQLARAQRLARIGSWEWDVPANRVSWSDELFRIYGHEPQAFEPTYERFLAHVHPADRDSVDERNRRAFADHRPFDDVKRIVRADGSQFLMRTQGEVICNAAGEVLRMIGICEDVTDRQLAIEARERLAAIVCSSDDAIVGCDPGGIITSWNPGAERLYGYAATEAVGRPIEMLLPNGHGGEEEALRARLEAGERIDHYETQRIRRDGTPVDVSLSVSAIRGPRGTLEAVSLIARDITERKRFEATLADIADRDALTGLYNRRRFEDELRLCAARAARHGEVGAVLVLDIDNFKYVNDTYGHAVGDELLRSIARVLEQRLRAEDVLARLGGDEFAVLIPHGSKGAARRLADDLLATVRHHSMAISGYAVRVTTSIGVTLFDGHSPLDALLPAADRAMYEAKDAGRDRCQVNGTARPGQYRRGDSARWERRIRDALDRDGFSLHCEPIVHLASGETKQFELLLRLEHEGRLVRPASFLGVAERLGLIHELDRWVVLEAISMLGRLSDAGLEARLEVNLSGNSVGDHELTHLISEELTTRGLDPGCLVFEITETAAIANMDEARRFAHELTELGCRFALDDFGTGFGSFSYLKHLPADYLKIDGDFVRSPRSRTDELVIAAIVRVARGLGKQTIAEYVTDADTASMLRRYGVDFAQGSHYGHGFPASELVRRLSDGG